MSLFIAALILGAQGDAPMGGQLGFSRDIESSREEAGRTGRPVIYYFTAEW